MKDLQNKGKKIVRDLGRAGRKKWLGWMETEDCPITQSNTGMSIS